MLFAQSFARGDALRRFLEQERGGSRGPAAVGERTNGNRVHERADTDAKLVADLELLCRLRTLAIQLNLSPIDRFGRQRPCLIEACGPKPLVEADTFRVMPDRFGIWHSGEASAIARWVETEHITDP